MKKTLYIADIQPGVKIGDYFLVTEKNLSFSQKGSPYLSVRLRDKTGELEGKVWDQAREWNKVFKKGDIVYIQSRSVHYKNNLQLSITDIKPAEADEVNVNDYMPQSEKNVEEMAEGLMAFVRGIHNPPLAALLESFFQDGEILSGFKQAPAAKGFHHVYLGGLLEHTLSVTTLLSRLCDHYRGLDRDLLIAGGILHDIGKIREFFYGNIIDYTDEGRLIGHVVMGVEMLDAKIAALGDFPSSLAMKLRHIILSHHGDLAYGSPKRPKTVEALIVHHVDDLDAKVNAFQEFIGASQDEESNWTPFHRLLERFIYKG